MYYGLVIKGTKKLLTVETRSNSDGDFCCDTQHLLSTSYEDSPLWLVRDRKTAEKAAVTHTEWYNAGWDTPSHGYGVEGEELEVVRVDINISLKLNGEDIQVPKSMAVKGKDD